MGSALLTSSPLSFALDLILWGVMMHQFISWCSFSLKGRLFVKIICVRRTPLNDRKDCD